MLKTEPTSQGLYVSPREGFTMFLRFYADGRAVGVSSTGTAQSVAAWLVADPPHPGCSAGGWQKDGDKLSFALTSERGSVEYVGTVGADGNTLYLASVSRINGHRGTGEYAYVSVNV